MGKITNNDQNQGSIEGPSFRFHINHNINNAEKFSAPEKVNNGRQTQFNEGGTGPGVPD